MPQEASSSAERSDAGLRVYTLGRFAAEVDGRPLRFGQKAQKRPLALLKVLVALGGEQVHVEQLTDSLWPESDGDQAYSAFSSTLARLRKLVGRNSLPLAGGRLSLAVSACWVDARAFEGLLESAARAAEQGDGEATWRFVEQALALYRGPFLEGEFEPPEILSARERLHSLFLRHVEGLGEFFANGGQVERAAALYRQGLEADDLAESLYQALMRTRQRQGRLVEAIAVYERCRHTLKARLGSDPSPETETLRGELVADLAHRDAVSVAGPGLATPDSVPVEAAQSSVVLPEPVHPAPMEEQATPTPGSEARFEGERRPATVAVLRLGGLVEARGVLDPEEVEEIVAAFRAEAERAVAGQGGIVNQHVRDEVEALFGLPAAHEDDPARAVRAALELHQAVRESSLSQGLALHAGIGTGVVVARARGEGHAGHEIAGGPQESAARLARLAGANDILADEETRQLLADLFEVEPVPPGDDQAAQNAWRVRAEAPVQTRFEAAQRRGFTPFVGRDPELAVLGACLERALEGQGQLVTVSGEAGVGKSRLIHEFRMKLDRDRVSVLQGRCQSYGATIPYLPLLDALRRGLRLHEETRPDALHDTAVANVRAIDPALEPHIPLFLHLLSIPSSEFPVPGRLQGPELQGAIHEALAALTLSSAQRQPLVWVLEDWHWADEASDAALQYLAGRPGPQPLLLVVVHRPDYEPRWGHPGHHTPIVLQALDVRQGEALVKAAWRAKKLDEGLAALMHERTGGNPFFIEEACRALVEAGAVRVAGGRAELTRPLERLALPDTVQAVIRARLDRLEPEAREVLRLAAVIGRGFDQGLLQRIVPEPGRLAEALETLRSLELVQQVRGLPEASWRFKHVLTQEVAYEFLLRSQRREVHARVARTIEEIHNDRIEEHVEVLAQHFSLAEEWEPAVRHGAAAAHKARHLGQFQQAVRQREEAIEWLQRLPDDRSQQETLVDLHIELNWDLISLGQFHRVQELCDVSEPIAKALGDVRRLGLLYTGLGISFQYGGDFERTEHWYRQALLQMEQDGDEAMIAFAKHSLGSAYLGPGSWQCAESWIAQAVATYDSESVGMPFSGFHLSPRAIGYAQVGYCQAVQGKLDLAIAQLGKAASDEVHGANNLSTRMIVLSWVGLAVALLGEDRFDALRVAEEFVAITEKSDSPFQRLGGYTVKSNILLGLEDHAGVGAVCERALRIVDEGKIRTGHVANLRYNLALTELALGRHEAAAVHYHAGRELAELSPHWWEPRYAFLEGLLLAVGDPADSKGARTAFQRSMAGDEEVGAVVPAAQTRYQLALLSARRGQRERARTLLSDLAGQFAQWGIMVWEAKCRAALADLPKARSPRAIQS